MDLTSYLLGKNSSGGGGGSINLDDYFDTNIKSNTGVDEAFRYIVKNTKPFVIDSTVTSLAYAFDGLSTYYGLNFEGTDTSHITNMFRMFRGCSYLKRLDLSSFDTSNVTTMDEMFENCSRLAYLDISSFTIPYDSASGMLTSVGMFATVADGAYAYGKPTIYVKDATMQSWVISQKPSSWSTDNVIIKE